MSERNLWAWAASLSSVQWRPRKLSAQHVRLSEISFYFGAQSLLGSGATDFNLNRKRGEIRHWHLEELGQYFINNTNILCEWSPFMSFYLNVAHTVLENKKFIPQNKNMARRKSCMSCASFEIFVSGLFSLPCIKEGIWPVVPARTVM